MAVLTYPRWFYAHREEAKRIYFDGNADCGGGDRRVGGGGDPHYQQERAQKPRDGGRGQRAGVLRLFAGGLHEYGEVPTGHYGHDRD